MARHGVGPEGAAPRLSQLIGVIPDNAHYVTLSGDAPSPCGKVPAQSLPRQVVAEAIAAARAWPDRSAAPATEYRVDMADDIEELRSGLDLGPTDDEDDGGEALESFLLDRDHAASESEQVTPGGQRRGLGLDDRLAREQRQLDGSPEESPLLTERDGPDDEAAMVTDGARESADPGAGLSAEESAVHVRDDAPGWTDHPDDYVEPGGPDRT